MVKGHHPGAGTPSSADNGRPVLDGSHPHVTGEETGLLRESGLVQGKEPDAGVCEAWSSAILQTEALIYSTFL